MPWDVALGLLLAGLFLYLGGLIISKNVSNRILKDKIKTYVSGEGVRDVVYSIASRVGDLADETFIRLIDVGCGHDERVCKGV